MSDSTSVLIIAPPGRLRDSLRVLLRASNRVSQVAQADDLPAGLRMLLELSPTLVLLDAAIPDDGAASALRQLKAGYPHLQCVVLTHTSEQERQARQDGADGILQAGVSAEAFFTIIEKIFQSLANQEI